MHHTRTLTALLASSIASAANAETDPAPTGGILAGVPTQLPSEFGASWLASMAAPAAGSAQVLGSPSVADDTFIKVRGGGFILLQSGSVQVGDTLAGTIGVLDFDDVLGQDDADVSPFGTITFAIPTVDLSIELGFLGSYEFDGTTTGQTISFDGQEFTGTIASSQSYEIYTADVAYELLEISLFKVYLGAGVRIFDVESNVAGDVGGAPTASDESAIVPLPVALAAARVDLGPNFFVGAELSGMIYGDYGSILDGSLEVGWDFFRNAGVFAGYRVIAADSDAFDVEIDLTLQGPYAGIELRI
ncbi:MAG: hypothetical protein AAGB48_12805 [Planctomycetota bacterium]